MAEKLLTSSMIISTLFIHWNHHHSSQSVKINMYTAIIRTNHLELTALHFSETIQTSSAKKTIYYAVVVQHESAEVAVFIITLNI